jgi:hypothetical protein
MSKTAVLEITKLANLDDRLHFRFFPSHCDNRIAIGCDFVNNFLLFIRISHYSAPTFQDTVVCRVVQSLNAALTIA